MIDVAEAAGVAKGTLYLYFETKEELLKAMIEAVVAPTVEKLQQAAGSDEQSATARLHRQLRILSQQLSKGEMLKIMRLMVAYGPQREGLRRFYFDSVVFPNMGALDRTLKDGAQSGEFSKAAATLDNKLLAAPFVMAAFWKILFQDVAELDEDALFQNVWDMATLLVGADPDYSPD